MRKYLHTAILLVSIFVITGFFKVYSQERTLEEIAKMSRDQVLQIEYAELMEMSLDKLMKLAEISGVSVDELYELILNKDINSASKKQEVIFESPLSTTVITQESIFRSGATSIPDALRMVPGIIVREKTNGNYDVHIRGNDYLPPGEMIVQSENSITLVMIDNRPVYSYFGGGTFWETLPVDLNDIDRIEVIRGPSAALYGPNAVSGFIHIITKKTTQKRLRIETDLQKGSAESRFVNGSVAFGLGKRFNCRVSGNYQYRNRFQEDYYSYLTNSYVSAEKAVEAMDHHDKAGINLMDMYPSYKRAVDKQAFNAFLTYRYNDKTDFNVTFGQQNSSVQTGYIEVGPFITYRDSKTHYFDFHGKINHFTLQVSADAGTQNAAHGVRGFQYDMATYHTIAEYEIKPKNGKFSLRPGLAFSGIGYSDSNYVDVVKHEGFINGQKFLASNAAYLRADYLAFDKLRLIGAVTFGGYYKPQRTYLSYQFVASFKIDNNNMLRFVASRANSSPMIAFTYANYYSTWRDTKDNFVTNGQYEYLGNQDLDLTTMDMIEVGFRNKLLKNMFSDFEFFVTKAYNFSGIKQINQDITYFPQNSFAPDSMQLRLVAQRLNDPLNSYQMGVSSTISMALSDKLFVKFFGTLQTTHLTDYYVSDSIALFRLTGAKVNEKELLNNPVHLELDNDYTPAFYGGLTANYTLTQRLNFNTTVYYYSAQYLDYIYRGLERLKIEPKTIVNSKLDFRFGKYSSVYVNARNLFNNTNKEFAYMDDIKQSILFGLHLVF